MFLRKSSKGLVVLLLFITAASNAMPTIGNCGSSCICDVSQDTDTHTFFTRETKHIAESCDYQLAGVADEFLKPPVGPEESLLTPPLHIKPLPAVPAASFMALIGFLCVSLVKDRRVWLAALTGLLWAGQTGIQALPQLVLRLGHGNHSSKQFFAESAYSNYLLNCDRLRSDVEGTRYMGLLHRLAGIPHSTTSFSRTISFLRDQESGKAATLLCYEPGLSINTDSFQFQPAFLRKQYSLDLLLVCLAATARQSICFSPAFIFENQTRGPPDPA